MFLIMIWLSIIYVFKMFFAKYLGGKILNLVECYLCLADVFFFYFSSICIKELKTKSFIFFFSFLLRENLVKKVYALRRETFLKI